MKYTIQIIRLVCRNYLINCNRTNKKTLLFINILGALLFPSLSVWAEGKLVLHYNFENETLPTICDKSGFSNDGTANSQITLVNGKFGQGAYFDGSLSSRIIIPASSVLDITDNLTISMWIKPSDVIIENPTSTQDAQDLLVRDWNWRCMLDKNGNVDIVLIGNGTERGRATNGSTLPENQWTHIAYVFEGSTKILTLYINGELVAQETCDMSALRAEPFPVYLGGGNGGWSFTGVMDEVKIYDYAQDAAEIKAAASMVLHYDFDNETLPSIKDKSGFFNNGTASSQVTLGDGIIGDGVCFSGSVDSRIIVPASDSLDITDNLTVSLWVKPTELIIPNPTATQDAQDLFFRDWNWRSLIDPNGHLDIILLGQDIERGRATNGRSLPENEWSHIVYVFEGSSKTLTLYINGKLITQETCDMSSLRSTTSLPIYLGGASSGWSFKGVIDEVKIYNCALNKTEIKAIKMHLAPADSLSMQNDFNGIIASITTAFNSGKCAARLSQSLISLAESQKGQLQLAGEAYNIGSESFRKIKQESVFLSAAESGFQNNVMNLENTVCFQVKAISDIIRLPDTFPTDGNFSSEINITAAKGEFEPASFVLRAFDNIENLRFTVVDFYGSGGLQATIPASSVDIRVVKCWYQADTAWEKINLINRNIRVMVPELLLHDEKIIQTDEETKSNFIRLDYPSGSVYELISDPTYAGKRLYIPVEDFPVNDSATLQPATMFLGNYKQFWITIKVPEDTVPGDYFSYIYLGGINGVNMGAVKIKLRVLPFTLPQPKASYDLTKSFTASVYNNTTLNLTQTGIDCKYRSEDQLRAEFINQRDHGITNPMCYQLQWDSSLSLLQQVLDLRNEVGLDNSALYLAGKENCQGFSGQDPELQSVQDAFKQRLLDIKNAAATKGYGNIYIYGIDEVKTEENHLLQRSFFELAHDVGVKAMVTTAGINRPDGTIDAFPLLGTTLDLAINCWDSNQAESARWHSNGKKIWMYNYPTAGVENPLIYRRNFGLKLWFNNYDGFATYLYYGNFGNPWNDFDNDVYRDHNFVYPTVDGVVDTIAWEGQREAVDDIRYGTLLKSLCEQAVGDPIKELIAADALSWLNSVDFNTADLDIVRETMINYIIQLQ